MITRGGELVVKKENFRGQWCQILENGRPLDQLSIHQQFQGVGVYGDIAGICDADLDLYGAVGADDGTGQPDP